MAKILVVEDDKSLCNAIGDYLALDHHSAEFANDGVEAKQRLKLYGYDLIILDWELPGATGVEVLKDFRGQGGTTLVLMLTGRGAISDKEVGLDAGADDYLTKPFHAKELQARVRALLRRPQVLTGSVLKAGDITLDTSNYVVKRGDEEIRLLPKEFTLLEFMMRHPGRVFAAEALLNNVWSDESDATPGALTTCVGRLRKKIDVDGRPSLIRTVHGVGYTLES
ncbi:MAG TPA: response regulator transcription factor [Oculatellaceae cyanobacterium]